MPSNAEAPVPLVETRNLTRMFDTGDAEGRVTALHQVSISINCDEFVAIQGPSGCGKSTLLHLLGGLDTPTSGSVWLAGTNLATLNDYQQTSMRRRDIGIVSPVVNLVPTLSTWENVAVSLMLAGHRIAEGRRRALDLLDQVKLGHRATTMASRLSTGEGQRVALARALFNNPRLVLADEPTSYLDSVRSDEVVALLRSLAGAGHAIVMATHDTRAAAYADRSIHLLDGHTRMPE